MRKARSLSRSLPESRTEVLFFGVRYNVKSYSYDESSLVPPSTLYALIHTGRKLAIAVFFALPKSWRPRSTYGYSGSSYLFRLSNRLSGF